MVRRYKKAGFTLIEVMIAVMILAVVLPASLVASFSLFSLNDTTRDTVIAIADARRVIEQMRSLAADTTSLSLNDIIAVDWTAWASANGCDNLSSEQVVVTYTDIDSCGNALNDNPLAVTVRVDWQEKSRALNVSFSTLITER